MRVLISAYIKENFGDDLLLETVFKSSDENEWYIIGEDNGKNTFAKYNVTYVSLKTVISKKHNFDALIFIGGSIFMENQGWLNRYIKRCALSLLFKLSQKNIYVLGSNFGPYNSGFFKKMHQLFFSKLVTHTTFRDKKSVNEFCGNIKNLNVTVDLVFSIFLNENTKQRKNNINSNDENVLGISLMDFKDNNNYERFLIENIKSEIGNGNIIKLFSFCKFEGDDIAIEKLLRKFDVSENDKIKVISYEGNIERFLTEFMNIDRLISTRFHATVLGLIFKIPQHPLMYSDKTLNMLNDLGYKGSYTKVKQIRNKHLLDSSDFNIVENDLLQKNRGIAIRNFELISQTYKGE